MDTIEDNIKSRFSAHFELMELIIRKTGEALASMDSGSILSFPNVAVVPLILKAFKTFQAGELLIRKGYAQDALMLSRTLFEILVTLEYIEQDVPTRSESFMRYYFHQMDRYIQRLDGYSSGSRLITNRFHTRPSRDWERISIRQRAIAVNRLREYELAYFRLCEVNHSGATGLNYYVQQMTDTQGDQYFVFNAGPREIGTADSIHYLMYFFCEILSVASRLLLPDLAELCEQVKLTRVGEIFMEQIKARLLGILNIELPGRNFLINANHLARSIRITFLDIGEELDVNLGEVNDTFVEPETLLGIAFQTYQALVNSFGLPNAGERNINSYVF